MKTTLQQILIAEQKDRQEEGTFGINACKNFIQWEHCKFGTSYYVLLEKYVRMANENNTFNRAMVLACWELINEEDKDNE